MAMSPITPPPSSSSRPPPNKAPQRAILASTITAPAKVAATEPMRMSRCWTWLSSWASTPRSSRGVRMR